MMTSTDSFLLGYGLNNDGLELFKEGLEAGFIKKGHYFITPGQTSRYLALIETGYLRTYHLDESANEITTAFHQPGMFCSSYYSFYSQEPSFEYIQAITDAEVSLLTYTNLQKLYSHSLAINIFGRRVLEKACIERDLRLNKIMHLSATEKYSWFMENYADVYKVSQLTHIASFLGIKPETLSRVRRKIIS